MNEDFALFELAVKLKEKGFDEPCYGWYYPSEVCGFDYKTTIVFNNSEYRGCNYKDMLVSHKDEKYIDAPTISQVLKWLREEKKVHIVCPFYKDKGFYYYVQRIGNAARIVSSFGDSDDCFDTAEQAAIAGIEYVLDNLI